LNFSQFSNTSKGSLSNQATKIGNHGVIVNGKQ